ncbi:MAG: hypothetical protein J5590_07445 [Clostridia bacterium]|nr:hypothetical protein [Clostridia bacterium]
MKGFNRLLSIVLSMSMTLGFTPKFAAFAETEDAVLLPAERAGIEGLPEGGTYFTSGNSEIKVEERGKYILTVYRDSDVSGE